MNLLEAVFIIEAIVNLGEIAKGIPATWIDASFSNNLAYYVMHETDK